MNRTIIVIILVIAAFISTLTATILNPQGITTEYISGFLLNLGTELIGAIFTFVLIDIGLEAYRKREEMRQRLKIEKKAIHQRMQIEKQEEQLKREARIAKSSSGRRRGGKTFS